MGLCGQCSVVPSGVGSIQHHRADLYPAGKRDLGKKGFVLSGIAEWVGNAVVVSVVWCVDSGAGASSVGIFSSAPAFCTGGLVHAGDNIAAGPQIV